jgi:hypothetical protein
MHAAFRFSLRQNVFGKRRRSLRQPIIVCPKLVAAIMQGRRQMKGVWRFDAGEIRSELGCAQKYIIYQ